MTPPPIIWYTDHDGIAVPTESPQPDAVPYMLARPMPIETAPRDGTEVLLYRRIVLRSGSVHAAGWVHGEWRDDRWYVANSIFPVPGIVDAWLPLPPAPEGA